jgi:predicted secreted protein
MRSPPHLRQLIMLAAELFAATVYAQEHNFPPHDARILKLSKVLGESINQARQCYETAAVIQRTWARNNGDGTGTVIHFGFLL